MPAGVSTELLNGIGVVALVLLFAWLLATGRLVTRREADNMKVAAERENNELRADRDVWRDNFLDQKGLMSQILMGQETTNRLLQALPHLKDNG